MGGRGWAITIGLVVVLAGSITYSLWPETNSGSAGDGTSDEHRKTIAQRIEELERGEELGDAGLTTISGFVETAEAVRVPNADVWLSVGEHGPAEQLTCEICGQSLLSCTEPDTAREVVALARAGKLQPKRLAQTHSDAAGHFSFAGVPAMHVIVVHASAPGLGEGLESVDSDADPTADAAGSDAGVDAPPTETTVTLEATTRFAGRVVDEKNLAVRGVHVAALDLLTGTVVELDADDRGAFSFPARTDARLWLLAQAQGYRLDVSTDLYAGGDQQEIRLQRPRRLRVETRLAGKSIDAAVEISGLEHVRHGTATAGAATFEDLPIGPVDITASFEAFVSPKSVNELDELETIVRVDLKPVARLTVEVIDEQGQSVPKAHVTVDAYGDSQSRDADEKGGLIVFDRLAEGMYEVRIDASGLRDVARRVDLHAGDNHLSVTLQQASALKGKVVDFDGKPVADATVELVSQIHQAQATTTDDQGTFTLPVDEPGAYRVRAREARHGVTVTQVTAPADGLVLKLEPLGRLDVQVVADRAPLVGAYVSVFGSPNASDDSSTAQTDDQGVARFAGLHGGQYNVNVEQSGFQHMLPATVDVAVGASVDTTVELQKAVTMTGRVVDALGLAVPSAEVRVEADLGEASAAERKAKGLVSVELTNGAGFTSEEGEFTVEGLKAGQVYTVTATSDDRAMKKPQKLKAPQTGLVLKLDPLPAVIGRVLDETGQPLHAFRVDGRDMESPDGRFSVGRDVDPAGKLNMTIDADGYQLVIMEREFTPDVGDVQLKKSPQVSGTVVDASGQPVSGVEVSCDACSDQATTAYDGHFTLSTSAENPDVVVTASKLDERGRQKGQVGHPITVTLQAPVRVEGIVKDTSGKPLQARITVREINGGDEKRVDSGPDGKFEIDLPEAVWMFITRASSTGQTVKVVPPKTFVTLGAPPGTCAVTITVGESVGDAWLVPGEPEQVPLESLDDDGLYAGAVAVDLPLANRPTRSAGLNCGVYTLVTTDSSGVRRERVDVRTPESTFSLGAAPAQTNEADVAAQPPVDPASPPPQQTTADPSGEP